jgi:threonine/homoserine/homoserine lactone efflux protein
MMVLSFYLICFWVGFFLCLPIGPVNLEVFNTAVQKQYAPAISIGFGAAIGDALWAMTAFIGTTAFMQNRYLEGAFMLVTGVITCAIGLMALKDAHFLEKKEEALVESIKKRKRWAIVKGLSMVDVNPLGIVSWMIALSFLKKVQIYIPADISHEIGFFITVSAGAWFYFLLMVFITHKMKRLFSPKVTAKVVRVIGYVLIVLSLYFFFSAAKDFFFPGLINRFK